MKQSIVPAEEINKTVLATLAPSPIHGVGVFAVQDIPKGAGVYLRWEHRGLLQTTLSELKPEVKRIIIQRWPPVNDGYPFLHPHEDVNLPSFINHSDDPNYSQSGDRALKDIKAGEEITQNYGKYKDSLQP